jgi:hypothetical protein
VLVKMVSNAEYDIWMHLLTTGSAYSPLYTTLIMTLSVVAKCHNIFDIPY